MDSIQALREEMFRDFMAMTDEKFHCFAERLQKLAPDLVTLSSIGKSRDGRDILLLTVTDERPIAGKKAFFVQGNIHSKELSGTVTGLDIALHLAENHAAGDILADVVFYLMPRCNPDGAERMVRDLSDERSFFGDYTSEANTIDRCDVDGDGRSAVMLIEHPDGVLCRSKADPRCLVDREPDSEGPFYMHMAEGMMHNWDGKTVSNWPPYAREYQDWNRNWPGTWSPAVQGAGEAPLSVPEVRMQAEFLESLPNLCGSMALHNGYGSIIYHEVEEADRDFYNELVDLAESIIPYPRVPVHEPAKSDRQVRDGGYFPDYCHKCLHIPSLIIELGTRENSAGASSEELYKRRNAYTAPYEVLKQQDEHPELVKCFLDWKEFQHPQLGKVEIGGGCPVLFANPLPDFLKEISRSVYLFAVEFAKKAAERGPLQ